MVRLKVLYGCFCTGGSELFQFQYGAIKSRRLKRERSMRHEFQFQYGAIKRKKTKILRGSDWIFQFQYGAIKSFEEKCKLQGID